MSMRFTEDLRKAFSARIGFVMHKYRPGVITRVFLDKEPRTHCTDKCLRAHAAIQHLGHILPTFGRVPAAEDGTVMLLSQPPQ
jgi:hypothetical protein